MNTILEKIRTALPNFLVKQIQQQNYNEVLGLAQSNKKYYEYELGRDVTYDDVVNGILECPPMIPKEQKFFIGLYQENQLIAIMDFLLGYPNESTVWIGLFMLDNSLQQSGIGTKVITAFKQVVKDSGYLFIQLGCLVENKDGYSFWTKNNFVEVCRVVTKEQGRKDWNIIVMEAKL
ncbi:GNAT family N-acetyltransferase [Paludicola sp. MB14-C6]|uniref:GNAT family N-acetyltransferase n=1 Tax=Paludihabitans sp. MB14-C6 TaxID=3070656 RepID=UPI0027DAE308|nr:GNAT family N-acetyltransferase [Paludicola sp. MB14-C6]WMJ24150.1 GNAT family N-acetyltransferase [Paludicola sp. MB14-C6]